ncbi:MAG: DUF420 domain-containing protein [Magnetococcales bacterium]|nr:DUF420 domain-containing protein [Magnetococcales bacterium]MBF0156561.1 DUF420 domain-containing protein [Magnetococcales bacterium]
MDDGIIAGLPHLQATLNASALALMGLGYLRKRGGDEGQHRLLMLAAVAVSAVFLVSYLIYHAHVGNARFAGTGWIRPVYFSILAIHVVTAALVVPMLVATLFRAFRGRREEHRRIARVTLPVWAFVSVTGIVVYLLAFHVYPAGPGGV